MLRIVDPAERVEVVVPFPLALVSFLRSQDVEALESAQQALKHSASHPVAHLLAAWLEQSAGRIQQAREHSTRPS